MTWCKRGKIGGWLFLGYLGVPPLLLPILAFCLFSRIMCKSPLTLKKGKIMKNTISDPFLDHFQGLDPELEAPKTLFWTHFSSVFGVHGIYSIHGIMVSNTRYIWYYSIIMGYTLNTCFYPIFTVFKCSKPPFLDEKRSKNTVFHLFWGATPICRAFPDTWQHAKIRVFGTFCFVISPM